MTFHSEFEMFNSLEEAEDTIDALNVYIAYLKGRIEKLECENEELMEKLWYTKEAYGDNSGYNEDSESSDSSDEFEPDIEEIDLSED